MFSDSIHLADQLDLPAFVTMFWHMLVFEVPRFLIAIFVIGATEAFRRAEPQPDPVRPLSLSVLMPGHNEGASLRQTVIGLRDQTRSITQVVVVDDGSTDDMMSVGQQLKSEGLIDVFVATGLRGGKSAAANLGLTYCTGDIVIIADIDTSFDRDALEKVTEPFQDPRVGAVAGNLAVRNPNASVIAKFQAIQYLLSISLGRRVTDMLDIVFIVSGAFGAFRREALMSVGGWEVGPGEDADITVKLRRTGWKIRFQPNAWALTDVPDTVLALVRQRLRWNRTLVRVRVRKFARMFDTSRHNFSAADALGTLDIIYFQAILPASFFVYIVWLFAHFGTFAWVILGVVTIVYMTSALISFLIAASVSDHYGRLGLLLYVPGYALFNAYVLRAIAVYAYLDELIFRRSYKDTYVPSRVLNQAEDF
ncbi:glycosyltransferase [Chelativorans sp. AA-79]|uniref:glycosyltransferase family 2 protein n=1 Tax=Chelativorans sp. AA-79 TaxID=3028735 RepID=UPI0023F9B305|nr:glycosyltransferase [Chelativorans sp. AA-79]WEX09059.1 glycosyltransferase [Chelativorans sp. AA-79]